MADSTIGPPVPQDDSLEEHANEHANGHAGKSVDEHADESAIEHEHAPESELASAPEIVRETFAGPALGIRRADQRGRLVLDATAAHHGLLGLGQSIVADTAASLDLCDNGSALDSRPNRDSDAAEYLARRVTEPFASGTWVVAAQAAASVGEMLDHVIASVRSDSRYRIVTLLQSDHGRSITSLAAGGREDRREGRGPLTPGFTHVDASADSPADELTAAIDDRTAAILLPVVSTAEGGRSLPDAWFTAARQLADQHDLQLIVDHSALPFAADGQWIVDAPAATVADRLLLSSGLFYGLPGGLILDRQADIDVHRLPPRTLHAGVAARAMARHAEWSAEASLPLDFASLVATWAPTLIDLGLLHDLEIVGCRVAMELLCESETFVRHAAEQGLVLDRIGDHTIAMALPINLSSSDAEILSRWMTDIGNRVASAVSA